MDSPETGDTPGVRVLRSGIPPGLVVVVTGASSGIGRATALAFARHGAAPALTARSGEALNRVAEALNRVAQGAPGRPPAGGGGPGAGRYTGGRLRTPSGDSAGVRCGHRGGARTAARTVAGLGPAADGAAGFARTAARRPPTADRHAFPRPPPASQGGRAHGSVAQVDRHLPGDPLVGLQ
ncbi:SDR family NAD(P)-dependent oxidoreductase [Streptomyces sp. NPDC053431]|uniref:SDR family NAD(P)-dependent oxidoreductase n=1 Tax=Streptomyces sp. NPDC053431 TaxID=3365703 RepID=UPI0037D21CDB